MDSGRKIIPNMLISRKKLQLGTLGYIIIIMPLQGWLPPPIVTRLELHHFHRKLTGWLGAIHFILSAAKRAVAFYCSEEIQRNNH